MDWKAITESLAKVGLPLIGAALPIPGGMAIGAALASAIGAPTAKPEDILATLTASADAQAKALQFQMENRQKLLEMAYNYEIEQRKADTADVAAVNATMTAEAVNSANESWYQKSWRPFNGFVVGIASLVTVIGVLWLSWLALVGKDLNALNAIPTVVSSIAMVLAIPGAAVGITAWHRGRAQIAEIQSSVK
jgi:roadblock/LC7 domain-containing protein